MKIDEKLIQKAIDAILKFFNKELSKPVKQIEATPKPLIIKEPVKALPEAPEHDQIDWSNPKANISKYFTVQEAIVLREWGRLGNESDGLNDTVKKNLVAIFRKMDVIREFIGKPIYVRSAWRPPAYNIAIGGAKLSAHMANVDYAAVDWWTDIDGDGDKDGEDCDKLKELLMPKLKEWGLRMEDNGKGARWIHTDNKPVPTGGNIFFKP